MVYLGGLKLRVQLVVTILLLFQGLCNRKVFKAHRHVAEQNWENDAGGEEFISGEKVESLVRLLKGRGSSRRSEMVVGDIRIRVVASRRKTAFPRMVLETEFGSQLNPLYYGSVSSSDRCLLMLGRHFRSHLREAFERHLSRAGFLDRESHIYFGGSRYYLELRASSIKDIGLVLDYIAAFFSVNPVSSSGFLRNYLLDLRVNGNRHFMPDNLVRNVFLTVLNDRFREGHLEAEGFRDIYGDLRSCASLGDARGFSKRFGHYFKRRLRRVELFLDGEGVSMSGLERVIRTSLRKIHKFEFGFDHLKGLTRVNPFSELGGGVLQISSNRMSNKVTLLFPIPDQLKMRLSEVSQFVERVLTDKEMTGGLLASQGWVSSLSHEFEHNDENEYVNLLLNFFSKRPLNSREELSSFNLASLIEVWLQALHVSTSSPARQDGRGRSKSIPLGPSKPRAEFTSKLERCLGIRNMVIVIYSNRPITIQGADILRLNTKMNEDRYWYLARRLSSISFLMRSDLLPRLGVKYLVHKEDYYFNTKYVYSHVPSSFIHYLQETYPESNRVVVTPGLG